MGGSFSEKTFQMADGHLQKATLHLLQLLTPTSMSMVLSNQVVNGL